MLSPSVTGSSPLSRGIPDVVRSDLQTLGIIPALAGNTRLRLANLPCRRDHPRSRGEYCTGCFGRPERTGSSPLSRGIRRLGQVSHRHGRIIPALAGNTRGGGDWGGAGADHPRSRGEYPASFAVVPWLVGSSPLSRGIRHRCPRGARKTRIIPALAGNTTGGSKTPSQSRDHPRSRGEYLNSLEPSSS